MWGRKSLQRCITSSWDIGSTSLSLSLMSTSTNSTFENSQVSSLYWVWGLGFWSSGIASINFNKQNYIMSDKEMVQVSLSRLQAKIRSWSDMYRILQLSCKFCVTEGKFYMPDEWWCTVRFMWDVLAGRKNVGIIDCSWSEWRTWSRLMCQRMRITESKTNTRMLWTDCQPSKLTSLTTTKFDIARLEDTFGRYTTL